LIFFHKILNFLNSKPQEIKLLEKRIKYNFNNLSLLHTALTHRSIKNPHKVNYEILEFLGDAIIDHVVSHWLFIKYLKSNEGSLTKKRAALVNRDFLAMLGKKLKIIQLVKIDSGVNLNDKKVSDNISADVYEAIVGAIYLDGGYKRASKFIHQTLCLAEKLSNEDTNYKGQLIEYCHSQNLISPIFETLEIHGPEHEKTFTIKVSIGNDNWKGIGTTIKSAEQDSAQRALKSILRN
jgi:ribonuclease-3